MLPKGLVQDRVERLATELMTAYAGRMPHLLCVLKGAHHFFAKLTEAMTRALVRGEHAMSVPFTFDFVRVKSYEGMESTGKRAYRADRRGVPVAQTA